VTRGKRLVVLVGQKKAVAIAVRNTSGRKRWSKLSEWLRPVLQVSRPIGRLGLAASGGPGLACKGPNGPTCLCWPSGTGHAIYA
jgi:hypothetical protein